MTERTKLRPLDKPSNCRIKFDKDCWIGLSIHHQSEDTMLDVGTVGTVSTRLRNLCKK